MLELLFNVHINDAFPHAPARALFACQIRLMELVYATFLNWFFMLPYTKSACTFTVLLPNDVLLFLLQLSTKKRAVAPVNPGSGISSNDSLSISLHRRECQEKELQIPIYRLHLRSFKIFFRQSAAVMHSQGCGQKAIVINL